VYEAGAAEDSTAPTTEEGHGGGAPGPAAEGEQAEAATGTAPSAPAGPKQLLRSRLPLLMLWRPRSPREKTLRQMLRRWRMRQSSRLRYLLPVLLAAMDPRRQQ
jgi:hypothetical protein